MRFSDFTLWLYVWADVQLFFLAQKIAKLRKVTVNV